MSPTTTTCTVTVVAREGHNGYWCAGRHFPTGSSEAELTQAEIDAIRADQALRLPIAVVEGAMPEPPAPPQDPPAEPPAPPPPGKRR